MSKNFPDSSFDQLGADVQPTFYPLAMEGSQDAPEGLLSWIVGLAQAHCVGPRTMVKHLLTQHERYLEIWSGSAFFERDSGTVNGLGTYAQMMCDVFGPALPAGTTHMTLQGLSHLLPRNGEGLLGKNPRWCHACLCDQARQGQRPHFPLVWSLEYYRVCHVHDVGLSEHCPACGCTQAHMPSYPSLLHCVTCGEPLLGPLPPDFSASEPDVSEFDRWCSVALVDLVSKLEVLRTQGSMGHFRANVDAVVERFAPGSRKRLCEAIGLQIYALNGWVNKAERPSLAVLLRLCHGVGILPSCMFLPEAVAQASRAVPVHTPSSERECRPMLGYRQRERIQKQLEVIVSDPFDHRGLAIVACQVGLTRHALKHLFPRQSKDIVLKNRTCAARSLEVRYKEDHDFLRSVIQSMHAQGMYPSRRRVNAALSQRRITLMRPDIFKAYERIKLTS
jgi:transcriptional regulator with XRE-family HTH domain